MATKEFGYYPLVTNSLSRKFGKLLEIEMGKNPNPARTNRTRTQVLPRIEMNPNPKVKNVQEPNRTEPYNVKKEPNKIRTNCHGSNLVLSLNEIVGTFTHFAVNEAFYIT